MGKIFNFGEFLKEQESFSLMKKAKDWATTFGQMVKDGMVKLIPSGSKKGKPVAVLFDGSKGSIEDQVEAYYRDTKFAKKNPLGEEESAEEPKESKPEVEENLDVEEQEVNTEEQPISTEDPDVEEAKIPLTYPTKEDVKDVRVDELKQIIKTRVKALLRYAEKGDDKGILTVKPYFVFGAPGIGKTQIVAQICDELGVELGLGQSLNLFNVDGEFAEPVDFAGVPSVVDIEAPSKDKPHGRGITRSNPSATYLPHDNGSGGVGGIIFIDELNRMDIPVIKVFMKLAQSRRLGDSYRIPDRWYIVAAGNRKEDDPATVNPLANALRDRFSIVNYVPTTADFKKHVLANPRLRSVILPELIDWFDWTDDYFHNLDPAKKLTKWPSPRAWVDASYALHHRLEELEDKGVKEITMDELRKTFQEEVGFEAASAFVDFYRLVKDIPIKDIIKVFEDPKNAPLPKKSKSGSGFDIPQSHAMICAIVKKSTELKLTEKEVGNFCEYLLRWNTPELGASALASFTRRNDYLRNDPDSVEKLSVLAEKWGMELGTDFDE